MELTSATFFSNTTSKSFFKTVLSIMWNKLFRKTINSGIKNSHEPEVNGVIGWFDYDDGETLATTGSENGEIIKDIEHSNGARITLEKDCGNIPFAITIGIYGLMFHTAFMSDIAESEIKIEQLKSLIEEIFDLYNIPESDREEDWSNIRDELLNRITYIDSV